MVDDEESPGIYAQLDHGRDAPADKHQYQAHLGNNTFKSRKAQSRSSRPGKPIMRWLPPATTVKRDRGRRANVTEVPRRLGGSFRVALRSQPIDPSLPLQPLIDLGLAFKALDVPNLGPCIMGFDLPIAFSDPFHFENDTLFSHVAEYQPFGPDRKAENGPALFNRPQHPLTDVDGTWRRADTVSRTPSERPRPADSRWGASSGTAGQCMRQSFPFVRLFRCRVSCADHSNAH
jgi:hypothetical protein